MAHFFIFTISALLMIVLFSMSLIGQAHIVKIKKVSHDFLHTVLLQKKPYGEYGDFVKSA